MGVFHLLPKVFYATQGNDGAGSGFGIRVYSRIANIKGDFVRRDYKPSSTPPISNFIFNCSCP